MILHAMSVIWMEPFEHVTGENIDHSTLILGLRNVDGKNAGTGKRAAKNLRPGHVVNNHVACVDSASCHLRDAVSARDRMIDDCEFASLLHFRPRSSVAAWRIAFKI